MKVSSGLFAGLIILTFGLFTSGSGDTAGAKYVPFTRLSEDAVVIQGDVDKEGQ